MNRMPSARLVVLFLAGVFVVGGGTTVWSRSASQASKARYEALLLEVPEENELREMVTASQAKVDEYKTQLQHLEQSVPSMAYVPTLLTEMEGLGKAHNITVTGVRPVIEVKPQRNTDDKASGTSSRKPAYQEMSIDITGRGSYANVMSMVEAIKKFPKIIAIQTVSMTPRRETAEEKKDANATGVVLEATVRIKAYLFPMNASGSQANGSGASS